MTVKKIITNTDYLVGSDTEVAENITKMDKDKENRKYPEEIHFP